MRLGGRYASALLAVALGINCVGDAKIGDDGPRPVKSGKAIMSENGVAIGNGAAPSVDT